jgi:hypothetical protein
MYLEVKKRLQCLKASDAKDGRRCRSLWPLWPMARQSTLGSRGVQIALVGERNGKYSDF